MTNLIIESCTQIGLSVDSANLYQALVRNPTLRNITKLSAISNLTRQKVYECLGELAKMELLLYQNKSSKKDFTVLKPTTLLAILKYKNAKSKQTEQDLTDNLIWINTPFENENAKKKLQFRVGEQAFLTYFIEKYTEAKDDILFVGSVDKIAPTLSNPIIEMTTSIRLRNNIKNLIITNEYSKTNYDEPEKLRFIRQYTDTKISLAV